MLNAQWLSNYKICISTSASLLIPAEINQNIFQSFVHKSLDTYFILQWPKKNSLKNGIQMSLNIELYVQILLIYLTTIKVHE